MIAPVKAVIGLEIHVQLDTRTKMFCGDAVKHDAKPNSDVCPVCLGLPGALPTLNAHAVELAIRAASLLQCTIHETSRFVRKNYFYPDLPKGYQITQLDEPLATAGSLRIDANRSVRISRVHLEEDAGKLLHDRIPGKTAIDLNRCGIPLLEIVTEPELRNARDAANSARALKQLLQYAGISECDMELGELRIDANVSLDGQKARSEIKNLNSFTHLERAIEQEIARQYARVESGIAAANETVAWDAHSGTLRVLRSKEQRAEYRYFAEPDLPPLVVTSDMIARATAAIPEMPGVRAARYVSDMRLPETTARTLAATRALADYFEAVVAAGAGPRAASAWVLTEVLGWCNAHGRTIAGYPVSPVHVAAVIRQVDAGNLTRDGAREVIAVMSAGSEGAAEVVDAVIDRLGVRRHVDAAEIATLVDAVLAEQQELAVRYRNGEKNLFGFMMGTVMARAGSAVDPRAVAEELRSRLHEQQ